MKSVLLSKNIHFFFQVFPTMMKQLYYAPLSCVQNVLMGFGFPKNILGVFKMNKRVRDTPTVINQEDTRPEIIGFPFSF